jgi:hypothetical protein
VPSALCESNAAAGVVWGAMAALASPNAKPFACDMAADVRSAELVVWANLKPVPLAPMSRCRHAL